MAAENKATQTPSCTENLADLLIEITDPPNFAKPEDALTYILIVSNNGTAIAEKVVLTIPKPFGLSCLRFSDDGGKSFEPWPVSHVIGRISSGGSYEISLEGIVDIDIDGFIKISAHVTSTTPLANLSDTATTAKTAIIPHACYKNTFSTINHENNCALSDLKMHAQYDITQSTARQKNALAHILSAEGGKVILSDDMTVKCLRKLNRSVKQLTRAVSKLETVVTDTNPLYHSNSNSV